MEKLRRVGCGVVLTGLLTVGATTQAGTVIRMETTQPGQPAQTVKMSLDNARVRMDSEGQTSYAIFRADKKLMWQVDTARREYIEMDEAAMEQMGNQLSAAMKQMEQQLAAMPAQQRAQFKQMMGNRLPMGGGEQPEEIVRASGVKQKVGGYTCERYDVTRGGTKSAEIWVASWNDVPISRDDFEPCRQMAKFFEDFTRNLSAQMPGASTAGLSAFDDMDGFPILIRTYANGSVQSTTTFKDVNKTALKGALFEVPPGYRERELMGNG